MEAAQGVEEILGVLNEPTVVWQTHARCLKHPLEVKGCRLPSHMDLEPHHDFKYCILCGSWEENVSDTIWMLC